MAQPNPNKGSFAVQINNSSDNCIFELYNLHGRLMYQQNVNPGVNQMELTSALGKGMYIGRVTDTKTMHRKTVRILLD